MTSEKWFDWDTSDESAPEAAEPASDSPAEPASEIPSDSHSEMPLEPEGESALPSFDGATFDLGSPDAPPEASLQDSLQDAPLLQDDLREDSESPDSASDLAANGTQASGSALQSLHVPAERPARVNAARPFHLRITGPLAPHEKEKLTELINREDFGIREVDLSVQLEAGRILLPRISEFAAVLVAQALKGSAVELRMQPSDLVSNDLSAEGHDASFEAGTAGLAATREPYSRPTSPTEDDHPAERIPVTGDARISGQDSLIPVDVLVATGLLREPDWRAESSDAYSELVESLKRELRYKAHLKKADALVGFEARVLESPWLSEKECRIEVRATAVRFAELNSSTR